MPGTMFKVEIKPRTRTGFIYATIRIFPGAQKNTGMIRADLRYKMIQVNSKMRCWLDLVRFPHVFVRKLHMYYYPSGVDQI